MSRPFFLLSNDDGVHAPGIHALAEAVEPYGDTLIVAPHVERSGAGQGISLVTPLRMERLSSNVYAVDGTPADCVMFALRKLVERKPDFIFSGINRGSNIGQDVLYSGTVAAAMEGCLNGIPAVAVSLAGRQRFERADYADAVKVMRQLLERHELLHAAHGGVLNVNIPDVPLAQMAGFASARLGRRIYDNQIAEAIDPRGRPYFWVGGGGEDVEAIPGSDCVLLSQYYITLTALTPDRIDSKGQANIESYLTATKNGTRMTTGWAKPLPPPEAP